MSGPRALDSQERLARVALTRLIEPGDLAVAGAVAQVGAQEVCRALRAGRAVGGITQGRAEGAALRSTGVDPRVDLDRLERVGGRLVCPGDDEWPVGGLCWPEGAMPYAAPLALFLRGPARLGEAARRAVAVVGARAATAYGTSVARELGLGLAERGITVVSGGAYGIDGAAHAGALAAEAAPTVAVLACGVDVAYPRGHDRLLQRVAATGLLVSEVPPGVHPVRSRFLVRNRLIAALAQGTVVVEAAVRSGSLSTAARADDLSLPVMLVPGPITSAASAGCHALIRRGGQCVTSAEEVAEAVGALGAGAGATGDPERGPAQPRDELSAVVRQVLDALPVRRGIGEATLSQTAGVPTLVVQQVLPPLLLAGLVERAPGGYRLTALGAGRPAPPPAPVLRSGAGA